MLKYFRTCSNVRQLNACVRFLSIIRLYHKKLNVKFMMQNFLKYGTYRIYSNKRHGIYSFQAQSLWWLLLQGGRYWRAAVISTPACTRDSGPFSSTCTSVCKEVTLVQVSWSCVIVYCSFVGFQFFVILTA